MEHYFDNSATTKVCDEAAAAALDAMTQVYGNPSSTHTKGREANKLLAASRKQVSNALGCMPEELFFTSCGSESDNWAIMNGADLNKRNGRHIISSAVEHDAVRKSLAELEARGYEITLLKPDSTGAISAAQVKEALRDDTCLVSLMMINNETGAVTDINAVSKILKEKGSKALLHSDAVQAFMKCRFQAKTLGADMISISGHKIHAPKGIGALYIRKGLNLKSFIVGGAQESGKRAGTESMPLIAAFGAACETASNSLETNIKIMSDLKEYITDGLAQNISGLKYIKTDAPHILSITLPGYRSEVLMNYLEAENIFVSKSSACKKGARSHVLEAIGMSATDIDGALRIGISRMNTREDADALIQALKTAHDTLSHR